MERKKKMRKCFLISAAGANTQTVKKLLKERNVKADDSFSMPLPGVSISQSIEENIKNSDFVVAIISLKEPRPNVFFELGLAQGSDKPVLLIVQDSGPIPADLKGMVYIRASADNRETIAFALDQFLLKYRHKTSKILYRERRRPLPRSDFAPLQKDLELLAKEGTGAELEAFLANLLKSEGEVLTQLHYRVGDKGVDIALWIDALEPSLGNPILVEVKKGILSEASLGVAEEQLRRYLTLTNTNLGLLIYLDSRGKRFKRSRFAMPLVIRLDARDLLRQLSQQSLANVLLSERNQIAHSEE
jgi:nucleoside 2-deoxyribosyltransferase